MKSYGFIYITTNTLNGMKYVGQTRWREKMNEKYFGSGKAIKRAILKHGIEVFSREIIFEAFTKENLNWAEMHFIKEFDAVKSKLFYNISPGGRASLGFTGKKHTKERNAALSEKMQGHKVTDKVRKVAAENGKKFMLDNVPSTAIPVLLDGIEYRSVKHAHIATGFSREKIDRFRKTGIHPNLQQDKRFKHPSRQ